MRTLVSHNGAKPLAIIVPIALLLASAALSFPTSANVRKQLVADDAARQLRHAQLKSELASSRIDELRNALADLATLDEPGALDVWQAALNNPNEQFQKEVWAGYRDVQARLIRNEIVPQVARINATSSEIKRIADSINVDFNIWSANGDETVAAAPPYLIERLRREGITVAVLFDSIAEWQKARSRGDETARRITPEYQDNTDQTTQVRIAVIELAGKDASARRETRNAGSGTLSRAEWLDDRENVLMRNDAFLAYLDLFASDGSAESINAHIEDQYTGRGFRIAAFLTPEEFSNVAPQFFPGESFSAGRAKSQSSGEIRQAAAEGRFHSYEETLAEFKSLAAAHPDLARYVKLGTSFEGREIFALKITRNAEVDDPNKPDVLVTGCHHAREWISVEPPVYFANQLINGYTTDDSIRALVDHLQIWVVPIINPDGLAFSQSAPNDTMTPTRLWRKSRRPIQFGSCASGVGVDLNRNYGYQWRMRGDEPCTDYCSSDKSCLKDDVGASDDPVNPEIYRGPQAESEPEVKAIKSLMDDPARHFRAQFDYHNYSQLILYPWGYQTFTPPDAPTLSKLADQMSDEIRKTSGKIYRPEQSIDLYATTGSAIDYGYAVNKIAAPFVIEMRPTCCDFNVAESEIDEVNRENWAAARMVMNWAAGPPILESVKAYSIGSDGTFSKQVYSARWVEPSDPSSAARQLIVDTQFPGIEPGRVQLRLQFSKTMNTSLPPRATLGRGEHPDELRIIAADGEGWQKTVYENDTWVGETTISQDEDLTSAWRLSVSATDLAGFNLDAKPETIADYATGTNHWRNYEDSNGAGTDGGADTVHVLSPTLRGDVPNVFIASPSGGERLAGGETFTVEWTVPKQPGIAPTTQAILFSIDGGATYERVVEDLPGSVEMYRITLPSKATTRARVRLLVALSPYGNLMTGDSQAEFTIGANVGGAVDISFISSEKVSGDWTDTPSEDSSGAASGSLRLIVNVKITNRGSVPVANPFLRVGDLTRGNVLLTRDPKSPSIIGARQTIDAGQDNVLSPGEVTEARLVIGLVSKKKFSLGLEMYGVPVGGNIIASSPFYVWTGKPKTR